MSPDNLFTRMQADYYRREAALWQPDRRDPVVGAFDAHNAWADYDLLFEGLDTKGMVALEFACGPGRNLARYAGRFAGLDGVDMDKTNLVNASRWLASQGAKSGVLWPCNGVDLSGLPSSTYDLVFSTIALQHIPVHAIRQNYFREFARVLRPGGYLTAQMGYGHSDNPGWAEYHEDRWDAQGTNGACDVKVTDTGHLRHDLTAAGFAHESFRSIVRPPGPGDTHPNWLFFRVRKGE
jgi:SAM-dependent methyltransferase